MLSPHHQVQVKHQIMPSTITLENPIEHSKINIIKGAPKKVKIDYVLSNSFGFGGTNVSLIFKNIN